MKVQSMIWLETPFSQLMENSEPKTDHASEKGDYKIERKTEQ